MSEKSTEPTTNGPSEKSTTIVLPFATPVGVTKVRVWSDPTAGAESERVSLSDVTLAASAKRNDGRPIDHRSMAKAAIAAIAWSSPNVVFVLLIFSLRCISLRLSPDTCTKHIR